MTMVVKRLRAQLYSQTAWIQILMSSFITWDTLGKLLNFSVPRFTQVGIVEYLSYRLSEGWELINWKQLG